MNSIGSSSSGQAPSEENQGSHESDKASSLQEQRQISLSREGIYSFLSRALLFEVDIEFLTMVTAVQPIIELLASSQQGAALKTASDELASVSSKAATVNATEKKKLLTELAVEYATLFLGTGKSAGREQVYPWESAYFTDPVRMKAEPYHEVFEAFKSVGYEKPEESKEAEDHIALELDFMAHLCRLTLASIDNGKMEFALGYVKLQKEFLRDHLLRWAGKFSERLIGQSQKSATEFYHAIAMMLEIFIKLDYQTLDDIAVALKNMSGVPEAPTNSSGET